MMRMISPFNFSLEDAGALFLDKITAVELDHLKVVVVQAFQKVESLE